MNREERKEFVRQEGEKKFLTEIKEKFGDKYDFSRYKYVNQKTPGDIYCGEHDLWFKKDWIHLRRGQACPLCSPHKKRTQEQFKQEYSKKYHDEYDLSNIHFIDMHTKIYPYCPKHNRTFPIMSTKLLLAGQGCPECRYNKSSAKRRRNFEDLIDESNKIHNNKYDYHLITNYKNESTPYPMICPEHGIFMRTFNAHITARQGCPECGKIKCAQTRTLSYDEVIEKAKKVHNGKYDYIDKGDYINTSSFLHCSCPIHGQFDQPTNNHLFGQGCPICKESKLEKEVAKLLDENNIIYERQKTFDWLKYKRLMTLDFYLPDFNIAIECQGIQHFEPTKHFEENNVLLDRDRVKYFLCKDNNINILYIVTDIRYNPSLSEDIDIYNEDNLFTSTDEIFELIENEKINKGRILSESK